MTTVSKSTLPGMTVRVSIVVRARSGGMPLCMADATLSLYHWVDLYGWKTCAPNCKMVFEYAT